MAGKNYGPNVSGYLDPTGRNWEDVIFQAGKAILDVEQNLFQDISTGLAEGAIRRDASNTVQTVPPMPSGWIANDFLDNAAGTLPIFVGSSAGNILTLQNKLTAHVNGWVFLVQHTNVINTNTVTLPAAPTGLGAQRTDMVFLEVWRLLLSPAGAVGPPSGTFGKSPSGRIWQQGNVATDPSNDLTLDYPDDILNATLGVESTKRVQIQYRLRVVSNVDIFTYPYGLNDPILFANSVPPNAGTLNGFPTTFNYVNQSAFGDSGLWIAGDGNPANALGTVDGYMYAIPLCAVFRRNSTAFSPFSNINGAGASPTANRPDNHFNDVFVSDDIADLRMAISPTGWSYSELLDKNATYLLDNALRSEWTSTASLGGGGSTGHTPFFSNQIGISSANGGTAPYSGDATGGGPRVAQFDNACRTFSARPILETMVVAVPAPGGGWANGSVVTINPSSVSIYPYGTLGFSAYAPVNVQFIDVLSAIWIGNSGATKRYDAIGTTVAVVTATNNAGLIEIQTAFPTALATGSSVVISGIVGTVEANGAWIVTVIDSTHFTLNNSAFVNPYTSGGSVQYSAIKTITGLGAQPVASLTLTAGQIAPLGLTNETLYVEILVDYPAGNGLSTTPTADEQALLQTFLVNNPSLLPNAAPIYFDPTLLTAAGWGPYSYFNATPSLAVLDWTHREAHMTYTTTTIPAITLSADSETHNVPFFVMPERVHTIVSVLKNAVPIVGGTTIDVTGRIISFTNPADYTNPGDTLAVSYKAIRPFPQNAEQVTIFFDTRAPQTVRDPVLGGSLQVIPKYIPKQLFTLTSGCASPDAGYPFPTAYAQTGGIYDGSAPSPPFTELLLNGEAEISISDFNATTGLLSLPIYVNYSPDPDQVTFLRSAGVDIDIEGRTYFKQTTPGQYIPNAYAQDLSDPQRHKVFLPFIAELAVDGLFGFAGQLVMVLLTRWAGGDAINGVFFDTNLLVSTTSASVFRLRNNMLNKRV